MTCPDFNAHMVSLLAPKAGMRVLDVGTCTGYQAAILAAIGCEVVTVEVRPELHALAKRNLSATGFGHVMCVSGDAEEEVSGLGLFDAMILGCAPEEISPKLLSHLREGGVLVGPEGASGRLQTLVKIVKRGDTYEREQIRAAWFIPMVPA